MDKEKVDAVTTDNFNVVETLDPEPLVLKMKFLPCMVRTFGCRNVRESTLAVVAMSLIYKLKIKLLDQFDKSQFMSFY